MNYIMGWKRGAAGLAFKQSEMEDADFRKGWNRGREAVSEAYQKGCVEYDTILNPLRLE